MSKVHFYSHLIQIETLTVELDSMELSNDEKHSLSQLIDSTLHHSILDAVLDELTIENKKLLLEHLQNDKHDEIWKLLNAQSEDFESKIKKTADKITDKLKQDVKEAKRLKKGN